MEPFLNALPTVATSPYALIAYVVLVSAWLILGLRVRRNKNLLDALEKIPSKQRLAALQDEMGYVRPPEGLTPEQWLKLQTKRYYFMAFALLCACLTLIGLVTFLVTPPDPAKKVGVSLNLYPDRDDEQSQPDERTVTYESRIDHNDELQISPRLLYLDELRDEDEVSGIIWWRAPFFLSFRSCLSKFQTTRSR